MKLFALPEEKIRVIQTETGGGFGGKEEYPSLIAGHAALLALEIRQASEDDLRPRGRHGGHDQAPSFAHASQNRRHRKTASCWRWRSSSSIDGGAYCTLSPVVLSRGTIHAAGPYFCPNVRIRIERRRDQRAAARRVSGFWRAAKYLRARATHG